MTFKADRRVDARAAGRFTRTHQLLHWLTAGLMAGVLVLAWWMINIDHSFLRARLLALHKSLGLTILAVTVVRIVWGLLHPAPPMPGRVGVVQRALAHLTHLSLYIVLIAMPVSGYMTAVWGSAPVSYFGLFTIPLGIEPDDDLADRAFYIHDVGQWALYALIGLHIAAALFHWLVKRDGIAARMGLGSSIDQSAAAPKSRY